MADVGSVWATEYVAEGARLSKKHFEELAEIASRIVLLAQKREGAHAWK